LYVGYWKVYGHVEEKKQLFHRYDRCRDAILRRLDAGFSMADLFAMQPGANGRNRMRAAR
jgi:hypothetical protein